VVGWSRKPREIGQSFTQSDQDSIRHSPEHNLRTPLPWTEGDDVLRNERSDKAPRVPDTVKI
jgi:hypothetical protein